MLVTWMVHALYNPNASLNKLQEDWINQLAGKERVNGRWIGTPLSASNEPRLHMLFRDVLQKSIPAQYVYYIHGPGSAGKSVF